VVLADAEDVQFHLVGELDLLEQVREALPCVDLVGGQLGERVDAKFHLGGRLLLAAALADHQVRFRLRPEVFVFVFVLDRPVVLDRDLAPVEVRALRTVVFFRLRDAVDFLRLAEVVFLRAAGVVFLRLAGVVFLRLAEAVLSRLAEAALLRLATVFFVPDLRAGDDFRLLAVVDFLRSRAMFTSLTRVVERLSSKSASLAFLAGMPSRFALLTRLSPLAVPADTRTVDDVR
jgi:hypothetical protein